MKRNILGAAIAAVLVAGIALAGCKKNDDANAGDTAANTPPAATEPAATPATPSMPDQAAPATGVTVTTVDLGNAVGADNRVSAPATSFVGTDTIHASVATDGAGGDLTARWTFQDGQVVDTQDKTIPAGAQVTDFSISKPDGWPAGTYKLEVLNNGMVVQTREFQIK
ncbi:MAG TPA: hypothetical protein VIG54_02145 [Lysobacter sp.]